MPRKPPEALSERSIALWKAAVRGGSRSLCRLALLEEALRALDQADRYRALLSTQDLLVATKGSGTLHMNPLVRAQMEAVETFTRLARLLGLQWDEQLDGVAEPSAYVSPAYGRSYLAARRSGPGNGHEADEGVSR